MDESMRARVWERWLTRHPYDADCTDGERDMLLQTMEAEGIALGLVAEDAFGPVGKQMADSLNRNLTLLKEQSLLEALRRTR